MVVQWLFIAVLSFDVCNCSYYIYNNHDSFPPIAIAITIAIAIAIKI